jgi:hypothetical protein
METGHDALVDFFLLDTNLFREATKSPENQLLRRLIPEMKRRGLDFGAVGTAVRLSPFGLLEALGIVVPMPPMIQVEWATSGPKEIYSHLFKSADEFFRQLPKLQISHLRKMHDEQIAYVNSEARSLFEMCVTGILARDIDLNGVLSTFLASDYFFKYQFNRDQFAKMSEFLACAFFCDVPAESPVSRFRLSKRMFDFIQPKMRLLPEYERKSSALKIKNDRDFLDTDIIQEITYGFPFEGTRHRVVALTFDSAECLEARALLHRQTGICWARKCTSDKFVSEVVKPFLSHPGGLVLQVDKTGAIINVVDLRDRFASMTPE